MDDFRVESIKVKLNFSELKRALKTMSPSIVKRIRDDLKKINKLENKNKLATKPNKSAKEMGIKTGNATIKEHGKQMEDIREKFRKLPISQLSTKNIKDILKILKIPVSSVNVTTNVAHGKRKSADKSGGDLAHEEIESYAKISLDFPVKFMNGDESAWGKKKQLLNIIAKHIAANRKKTIAKPSTNQKDRNIKKSTNHKNSIKKVANQKAGANHSSGNLNQSSKQITKTKLAVNQIKSIANKKIVVKSASHPLKSLKVIVKDVKERKLKKKDVGKITINAAKKVKPSIKSFKLVKTGSKPVKVLSRKTKPVKLVSKQVNEAKSKKSHAHKGKYDAKELLSSLQEIADNENRKSDDSLSISKNPDSNAFKSKKTEENDESLSSFEDALEGQSGVLEIKHQSESLPSDEPMRHAVEATSATKQSAGNNIKIKTLQKPKKAIAVIHPKNYKIKSKPKTKTLLDTSEIMKMAKLNTEKVKKLLKTEKNKKKSKTNTKYLVSKKVILRKKKMKSEGKKKAKTLQESKKIVDAKMKKSSATKEIKKTKKGTNRLHTKTETGQNGTSNVGKKSSNKSVNSVQTKGEKLNKNNAVTEEKWKKSSEADQTKAEALNKTHIDEKVKNATTMKQDVKQAKLNATKEANNQKIVKMENTGLKKMAQNTSESLRIYKSSPGKQVENTDSRKIAERKATRSGNHEILPGNNAMVENTDSHKNQNNTNTSPHADDNNSNGVIYLGDDKPDDPTVFEEPLMEQGGGEREGESGLESVDPNEESKLLSFQNAKQKISPGSGGSGSGTELKENLENNQKFLENPTGKIVGKPSVMYIISDHSGDNIDDEFPSNDKSNYIYFGNGTMKDIKALPSIRKDDLKRLLEHREDAKKRSETGIVQESNQNKTITNKHRLFTRSHIPDGKNNNKLVKRFKGLRVVKNGVAFTIDKRKKLSQKEFVNSLRNKLKNKKEVHKKNSHVKLVLHHISERTKKHHKREEDDENDENEPVEFRDEGAINELISKNHSPLK